MRFVRRLLVVCLVAAGIVAAGWGIKHVDPVYAYFQKSGSPDGVEGGHEGQTPKTDEARPTDDTAATPANRAEQSAPAPDPATPKADESNATPGDDANRPPKEGDVPRDNSATTDATEVSRDLAVTPSDDGFAGDETAHPSDEDGKEDDTAHEQWPALEFSDASHAAIFMAPTAATVVAIDVIRRKRRPSIRTRTHASTR